jgi:hypothetical protein
VLFSTPKLTNRGGVGVTGEAKVLSIQLFDGPGKHSFFGCFDRLVENYGKLPNRFAFCETPILFKLN